MYTFFKKRLINIWFDQNYRTKQLPWCIFWAANEAQVFAKIIAFFLLFFFLFLKGYGVKGRKKA